MPKFFALLFLLISFIGLSQSDELTVIKVNEELKVISDITRDSVPNGRYLVVYKNKTLLKGRTKNGLMTGVWISYYPNSQQKLKGLYVDGKKHGEWTYWGAEGEVLAKFSYNRGKPFGRWQGYYIGHHKAIDLVYNTEGEIEQCVHYYFSSPVALNFEYEYTGTDVKSERSYYYENFNIFQYEQLSNGIMDGSFQRYFDNSVIWESFTYQNGKLLSVEETRSKGGMPKKNEDFREGNGTITRYYTSGKTYSKTQYKDGIEHGTIQVYDQGGNPTGNGEFENGNPIGKWMIYSKYHAKMMELNFDTLSKLVEVTRPTSPAPKERKTGFVLDGYNHGIWKQYDAYGDLLSVKNYKFGYLDGKQTFYETKKMTQQFSYSNGNKNGKFTYYNTFGEVLSEETFESETFMDSNWYKPPDSIWVAIINRDRKSNMIKLRFYPPIPGLGLLKSHKSYYDKREYVFLIQRSLGYSYWPELVPVSFPGGYFAEKEYIQKGIKIPNELKSKRINGTVLLRYKVDEFGMIDELTVLKSIGFGLDEMAINIVKSFPPQNPATFNGIPIESYIVREIDFKF